VPWEERLRWFKALHSWLEPRDRQAVRALVVDAEDRVLLVRFESPVSRRSWWITPGGGIDPGESAEEALRRELIEETGLHDFELGPVVWARTHVLPWAARLWRQHEQFYLVRVESHEHAPAIDLEPEHIVEARWWTLAELEATEETVGPPTLAAELRKLLAEGPLAKPVNLSQMSQETRMPQETP
jgi:8-oxo-dGTP pyrophosphatase MutT (NUDIX family)